MGERFRFRLPWQSAAPTLRPAAEPQTPRPAPPEIVAPSRPVPIQRPPFRPAGIAPTQPPPVQTQAPQVTEPQPPPPPQQITPQTAFPFRTTAQTRAASVPSSPSRMISESRLTSQPPSPARVRSTSQTQSPFRSTPQSRAASLPPSPTHITSQSQPPPLTAREGQQSPKTSPSRIPGQQQTVSESLFPPKKLQDTTKETPQPPPVSAQPPLSVSQQDEPKPEASLPSQPAQPSVLVLETKTATRDDRSRPHPEPEPESVERMTKAEERKKVTDKIKSEEKKRPPAREKTRVISSASSSGPQTKEFQGTAFNGEQIKTVSSTHFRAKNSIIEPDQKTFVSKGEHIPLHKEIREDISKFIQKLGTGQSKQPMDEKPVSVITLAGENRGATMHVGSESAKKEGSVHIHRGYKTNPDESTEGTTTDGETSSKRRGHKDSTTEQEPETKAYINSNIQSINNSIMFDSTVSERSPGVYLDLSYKPTELNMPSTKPEPLEARRAEFGVTLADKLTYEPRIRRRCLRGLFLEPSDSEPDNPDKPRRHGCRFTCGEKGKDKDVDIF